jgi:ankyrin repeat protein
MKYRLNLLALVVALSVFSGGCGLFVSSHHNSTEYSVVVSDASAGHLEAVKAAVQKDRSILKTTGWDGETLLHVTVGQNHKDVAEFLLNEGADVNALTADKLTPLHMAAQNGNLDIVKLLLDHKANINAVDSKGWTPVDRATKWNHPETADFLRQQGGH